jgi:Rhodopirellula transposase DDE domain
VVRWISKSLGYRLQANRKTHEGGKHPDRNAQFLYIKAQKEKFVAAGRPILSIDAKKKEPIGNYKNGGCELCAKSSPEHVNVYDFVDPEVGRATPYGVYDITQNKGWVSVGISFDTARFAVNTLRQWVVELRRKGVRGHARSLGECGWRRQRRIARSVVENIPSRICQ